MPTKVKSYFKHETVKDLFTKLRVLVLIFFLAAKYPRATPQRGVHNSLTIQYGTTLTHLIVRDCYKDELSALSSEAWSYCPSGSKKRGRLQ